MPELPEVERIVRGLRQSLLGQRVERVSIRWPGILASPDGEAFTSLLCGATLHAVERRGKMILMSFSPWWLTIHLRMTGQFQVRPAPDAALEADKHVHLRLDFERAVLYYRDVRKFGRLALVADLSHIAGGLGLEPLSAEFTPQAFGGLLARRRQLKPLLLDQRLIAGLGNIYVDEALWRAGLHPQRLANSLSPEEIARLHGAVQQVLREAIDHGGTTLRDYRGTQDERGRHQEALAVYGRAGQPCPRCSTPIVRIRVGGRGTHLCPACQPISPAQ